MWCSKANAAAAVREGTSSLRRTYAPLIESCPHAARVAAPPPYGAVYPPSRYSSREPRESAAARKRLCGYGTLRVVVHDAADDSTRPFAVLVFSRTTGYRHSSIPAGIEALRQLGHAHRFAVTATEDTSAFTWEDLARCRAVIWLSTSGNVLNDDQRSAFEGYIREGRVRRCPRRRRHGVRLDLVRRPGWRLLPLPPRAATRNPHRSGPGAPVDGAPRRRMESVRRVVGLSRPPGPRRRRSADPR